MHEAEPHCTVTEKKRAPSSPLVIIVCPMHCIAALDRI